MKKIEPNDPETKSSDVMAENIERLKSLFPEIVTEGKHGTSVNVDVLKTLVGDKIVTDADEKYGLNWHGKRQARQLALTPSTGTLRPCADESVDWDTTQNLMIEGDNLEVLKLLQKSYAGRVKLIYIDPPYNTGKDFVYRDDFQDTLRNYLAVTGQTGDGSGRVSTNTETSGRFHTDWLNMIYPRIRVARDLLRQDGALFISIDDNEVDSLKKVCCEVFGEENFVGILCVLVNPRGRHLDRFIAKTHEYLLVFVKHAEYGGSIVGQEKEGGMLEEYDREDKRGKHRVLGLRNRNQAFNPQTRPNLYYPLFVNPKDGRVSPTKNGPYTEEVLPITSDGVKTCWTWGREKVEAQNDLLVAEQMKDGSWRVFRKDYIEDENGETATTLSKSMWNDKEFNNDYGRKCVKALLGSAVMDFPKSPHLMRRILAIGAGADDLVLDFFAGSGTIGQAVYEANAEDGGQRRFVLVQLQEQTRGTRANGTTIETVASKAGYETIGDLCKERLRRAAEVVRDASPMFKGDLGFRCFKLASSNIQEWVPNRDDIPETLEASVDHLKADRTESDILYELLLKLGLDLCVPIEEKQIAGKTVHSVGLGVLLVCLADKISRKEAEPLALGITEWHKELAPEGESTVVFRDSAFADDVAKTNAAAILDQYGITNVRSL